MNASRLPMALLVYPFNAAHAQARLDAAAAICPDAVAHASRESFVQVIKGNAMLYRETEQRAQYRALFDAASAMPDVVMAVSFVKDDQQPRTMLCQPIGKDSDYTKRYVTVWDIEAGAYRRVNLDGIVKVSIETHSMPKQFNS